MPVAREQLLTTRFALLWTYAFVTFFSAFQLLPAIPFRIVQLGGSKSEAGWFLTVYTYASAFSGPVMGSIADRIGRKRLLVGASLLFILFSLAYGSITFLPLLWVVGVIHGALWSGILSSSSAIMSEFIPDSRRAEGMAYWGLASISASAIAPAIGLAIHFRYGWRTLCFELAALSLVMALWATRLPHHDSQPAASGGSLRESWDWGVIRTTLSLSVASFGYGGITSFAAMLAVERHINPPSLYFAVFASTIIVVRVTTGHFGDRYGATSILYPSLAAVPVAFALLAIASQRWLLVVSAVIFGAGWGSAYPAFAAFILANTDPARRGRTFGSILWAFDTGIGTGSMLIGIIGQHYGLGTAFAFAAALSCLSIPIFAVTSRTLSPAR